MKGCISNLVRYMRRTRGSTEITLTAGELAAVFTEIEERLNALEFEQRTRAWGLDPSRDVARDA